MHDGRVGPFALDDLPHVAHRAPVVERRKERGEASEPPLPNLVVRPFVQEYRVTATFQHLPLEFHDGLFAADAAVPVMDQ